MDVKYMNKINYDLEMEKIIMGLDLVKRPKLLLHSCCGPCSSAVLERLMKHFAISVYYYNPNLDSKDEFNRRTIEQDNIIKELGSLDDVKLIVKEYDQNEYNSFIKGYEREEEGGLRCLKCFELRLKKTAEYAAENGFDFFTTTLSISPHKDSQVINRIGSEVGENFKISYLYSDFKKKNGYARSVQLSKEYNLYRQDYCGCIYSKREAEIRRLKLEKII